MGTHRSTTTNQQVGLRITEMWEASRVSQKRCRRESETKLSEGEEKCTALTVPSLFLSLWTHTTFSSAGKKTQNFQPRSSCRKKVATPHFRCQKNVPRSERFRCSFRDGLFKIRADRLHALNDAYNQINPLDGLCARMTSGVWATGISMAMLELKRNDLMSIY